MRKIINLNTAWKFIKQDEVNAMDKYLTIKIGKQ